MVKLIRPVKPVVRHQAEGPGLRLSKVLQAPRPRAGGRCWGPSLLLLRS